MLVNENNLHRITLLLAVFCSITLVSFNVKANQFQKNPVEHLLSVPKKNGAIQQTIVLRPLTETQLTELYYGKGIEFVKRGERGKALQQFQRSLQYDKTNSDAVVAMSKLYFKDNVHAAAISSLSISLRYNSNHAGIVTQLAHHYTALHRYKKVIDILYDTMEANGGDIINNGLLAYAYIQTNNFELATSIYLNLLTIRPNEITWQLGKAIGFEGGGNIEQALSSYVDLKSRFSLTTELTRFVNLKIVNLHDQQQLN